MIDEKLKKDIQMVTADEVQKQLKGGLFTARKITDTPTDALSVVNRKFVTQNGTTSLRPTSSVVGMQYFDTTIGKPIYWNGSTWVDSTGTPA